MQSSVIRFSAENEYILYSFGIDNLCFFMKEMDKAHLTLAFWHFYEDLVEKGMVAEFPLKYYHSREIGIDAVNHLITFPGGGSVELTDLERTIYILFLRHPEGIMIDMRWRYYTELLEIYRQQSGSSDPDWRERRIDDLCDDNSANFSSHISHIHKKLQKTLSPLDADRFCIRRHEGKCYRIGALMR